MAGNGKKVEAVAYIRTSSAANVGADKDSDKRQRAAIEGYAKRAGFALVDEFNDAAVSGADPIETRPGFAALLDRIEGNDVRTVIVEDASRFARELVTQELGILALIKRGVRVLTANGDDLTDSSDPSRTMMRQIAGSFAEYEKARLVVAAKGRVVRPRAPAEASRVGADASRYGIWIVGVGLLLIATQLAAQIMFEYIALWSQSFRSRELSSFYVGLPVVIVGAALIAYAHGVTQWAAAKADDPDSQRRGGREGT